MVFHSTIEKAKQKGGFPVLGLRMINGHPESIRTLEIKHLRTT